MLQEIYFLLTLLTVSLAKDWSLKLDKSHYKVNMDKTVLVKYNLTKTESSKGPVVLSVYAAPADTSVAHVSEPWVLRNETVSDQWLSGEFQIEGTFLGLTRVTVELYKGADVITKSNADVTVTRGTRTVDRVFTVSVAVLVALIYVNFGCALDWTSVGLMLKRPIAPCLGLLCQFLIMPTLALALGATFFPDDAALRLGLLFVGVSPAGGASNVWTCVLDGNVDLSVTMTALGTLATFVTMPLWLFTAGHALFKDAALSVPYSHVAYLASSLIFPLIIGWILQKYSPRFSTILARKLKMLSGFLIILIVVFAVAINLHMWRLFTWKVALSGAILPWTGFLAGFVLTFIARRPWADMLAIAIETGIQNTGIAIFLLRFSLPQPQADLTTVVPVAVAIATPLPLCALWLSLRFKKWFSPHQFTVSTSNVKIMSPSVVTNHS